MKKSLVLEGGGMRGAYTAGCLKWLIENNFTFDCSYGISAGAVLLAAYELKEMELLKKITCDVFVSPEFFGLNAFLKEGQYVAYKQMFQEVLAKDLKFDPSQLKSVATNVRIGLYDLQQQECVYYPKEDITIDTLMAACSLPIVSKSIVYKNKRVMDGGISKMVPIEQSILDGNKKHLVICTKPENYVRPKSSSFVGVLLKLVYRKFPKLVSDYMSRSVHYHQQMDICVDLQKQGHAILIRPSKEIKGISRFKGEKESLAELFELGYQDMEKQRDQLIAMFAK